MASIWIHAGKRRHEYDARPPGRDDQDRTTLLLKLYPIRWPDIEDLEGFELARWWMPGLFVIPDRCGRRFFLSAVPPVDRCGTVRQLMANGSSR